MNWIIALTTGVVFGVGIFHILQRDAVRLAIGYSLILGATNLFLLSCSIREGTAAPYAREADVAVDPLPQVLVLTALVIGFGVLSWVLALILAAARSYGTEDLDSYNELRR